MSKPWDRLRVPPVQPKTLPILPGKFSLPGGAMMELVSVLPGGWDAEFAIDGAKVCMSRPSWRCAAEFILEVLDETEGQLEQP